MKKLLIAGAVTIMCSSAFAQTTGLAAQSDNINRPGMANPSGNLHSTTGQGQRDTKDVKPNGISGGSTSLSGTGSSQYGGGAGGAGSPGASGGPN